MTSTDMEAKPLPDDVLPTELHVYQHFLHLEQEKKESGEWTNYTSLTTKARSVAKCVSDQWDKTTIPHVDWSGRQAVLQVERLVTNVRNYKKNFKKGKSLDLKVKFGTLLDIARCKCAGHCSCALEDQVPPTWKTFLEDQRGERQMVGALTSKKLSLRGASAREEEDRKRKAEIEKREAKKQKQGERSRTEMEEQFKMVKLEEISDLESDEESEEEWKDLEEENKNKEHKRRNRKPLPIISAGCDRFKVKY